MKAKNRLILSLAALGILAIVLGGLYLANHIDFQSIATIYLPLLLFGLIAILAKQTAFSTLLFSSAAVGLLVKLFFLFKNAALVGSIFNTVLLFVGVAGGVMLQASVNRKRKARKLVEGEVHKAEQQAQKAEAKAHKAEQQAHLAEEKAQQAAQTLAAQAAESAPAAGPASQDAAVSTATAPQSPPPEPPAGA